MNVEFSEYSVAIYLFITRVYYITLCNRENEQLSKYGDTKTARNIMLIELKKLIEANPLFRDKLAFPALRSSRLRTLINQRYWTIFAAFKILFPFCTLFRYVFSIKLVIKGTLLYTVWIGSINYVRTRSPIQISRHCSLTTHAIPKVPPLHLLLSISQLESLLLTQPLGLMEYVFCCWISCLIFDVGTFFQHLIYSVSCSLSHQQLLLLQRMPMPLQAGWPMLLLRHLFRQLLSLHLQFLFHQIKVTNQSVPDVPFHYSPKKIEKYEFLFSRFTFENLIVVFIHWFWWFKQFPSWNDQ